MLLTSKNLSKVSELEAGDFVLVSCALTEVDAVGFAMRRLGIQIRDCISCQGSEERPLILVGTIPSDQTFLEGVLRRGNGVLDIDASRIGEKTRLNSSSGKVARRMEFRFQQLDTKVLNHGRFPANLIFKHSEGCRCEGTKKVKKGGGNGKASLTRDYSGSETIKFTDGSGDRISHYDEDGKEEVPNWICEPTCPVRALDGQSGELHSQDPATRKGSEGAHGTGKGTTYLSVKPTGDHYDDSGGASRFFKQVQSDEELNDYLETLIRGSS